MKITNIIHTTTIYLILFTTINAQNVGVGTTNPSDALHVLSNTSDHALRVQVGNATKLRVLSNGGTTIGTNNISGTTMDGLYVHGNTGLGVSNANDKLDVEGNIDLTGEIKTNGISGQEGQVLVSNGNGTMSWTSPTNYKYFREYFNTTNTFNVPTGVTEILVELWGAGGGGGESGGGGAGGYVQVLMSVTPNTSYTIDIGVGGIANNSGTNTTIRPLGSSIIYAQANGGQGALPFAPGFGGFTSYLSGSYVFSIKGEPGQNNEISFAERTSGQFVEIIHYGRGGSPAYQTNQVSTGATEVKNLSNNAIIYQMRGRTSAYGAGGGGGFGVNAASGANGHAIVRWN